MERLTELYTLIRDIDVVMLTTRRSDGHLVSRPMETQQKQLECDLWLATYEDAHMLAEIERDPHVCLAYSKGDDWISVSGLARIAHDGLGAAHIEITVVSAMAFGGRVSRLIVAPDEGTAPTEDMHHFG